MLMGAIVGPSIATGKKVSSVTSAQEKCMKNKTYHRQRSLRAVLGSKVGGRYGGFDEESNRGEKWRSGRTENLKES